MFGCLYSLSVPLDALITIAEDFTPRYERVGGLVLLDLSGLTRLFGTPREMGEHLRRAASGPVRVAIAPSQTAAALLALGRAGLTVVAQAEQPPALAPMPVSLLGELERLKHVTETRHGSTETRKHGTATVSIPPATAAGQPRPPHVADMEDVLPYFESCLDRAVDVVRAAHSTHTCGGGWSHPRDSHAAHLTKRRVAEETRLVLKASQGLLETLRRWGIKTLGDLAALPAGDVYERLGARGVSWQRLARGEDRGPMVPCVADDPFEDMLELEWPIEGLEPLSFVLARLFEPLADRLERADRGAAILHTHLRLTTREVYARTVQLPAPMRDPKTLRTLALLDLESNPPTAAIDRVRVLIEPTPARVLQWTLFERAQPAPEQVSTLLARLTALMGQGHVGSPCLVNAWKPGAFEMRAFSGIGDRKPDVTLGPAIGDPDQERCGTALRRFRLPVPARVQMHEGRPVRVMVDRRGVDSGVVTEAAGPWRTSGEWWNDGPSQAAWDRDEWDVLLATGAMYRIFVERAVGQWFIEGIVD